MSLKNFKKQAAKKFAACFFDPIKRFSDDSISLPFPFSSAALPQCGSHPAGHAPALRETGLPAAAGCSGSRPRFSSSVYNATSYRPHPDGGSRFPCPRGQQPGQPQPDRSILHRIPYAPPLPYIYAPVRPFDDFLKWGHGETTLRFAIKRGIIADIPRLMARTMRRQSLLLPRWPAIPAQLPIAANYLTLKKSHPLEKRKQNEPEHGLSFLP